MSITSTFKLSKRNKLFQLIVAKFEIFVDFSNFFTAQQMLSLILDTEFKKITMSKLYDSHKWYVMLIVHLNCVSFYMFLCFTTGYHLFYTVALYQLVRNALQQQALKIKNRQKDFERMQNEEKNIKCARLVVYLLLQFFFPIAFDGLCLPAI